MPIAQEKKKCSTGPFSSGLTVVSVCLYHTHSWWYCPYCPFNHQSLTWRVWARVDNDNHFASFFAKKWLQTIIVFCKKNDVIIAIIVIFLCPPTAHCLLYVPLSPLQPSVPLLAVCPPPRYSVPSMPSAPNGPLLPLRRSVKPLRPSIPSTALYPLYDPLFPQQPSVLSSTLIPSMALRLL